MKYLFTSMLLALVLLSCKKKENKTPDTPEPVTSIGASYAGGVVFYLSDDGQHGLVVTESDLGEYSWHTGTHFLIGTTSYEFGQGSANTTEIVAAQGSGSYAAKVCDDLVLNGYSDWYLPSKDEIYKIAQQDNLFTLQGQYWTSTEYTSADYAWYIQMGAGQPFESNISGKSNLNKVRAIREF